MGTKLIAFISTALLSIVTSSAIARGDMIVNPAMDMEASSICGNGNCMLQHAVLDIPGLAETKDLIQNVNIYYEDDRQLSSQTNLDSILAPAGQIEGARIRDRITGQVSVAQMSAALYSPCLVVSMGPFHGVRENDEVISLPKITTFKVGRGPNGKGFKHEVKAKLISEMVSDDLVSSDRGLYLLSDCVGTDPEIGWFEIEAIDHKISKVDNIMLAGFYSDKNMDAVWLDPKCNLRERSNDKGVWFHDCAARAGTSGGILFRIDNNGIPRVLAMHAGAISERNEIQSKFIGHAHPNSNANYALDMGNIYEQMKDQIEWDKMSWDGENPQIAMAREQGKPKVQKVKHTIEVNEPKEPRRYSI